MQKTITLTALALSFALVSGCAHPPLVTPNLVDIEGNPYAVYDHMGTAFSQIENFAAYGIDVQIRAPRKMKDVLEHPEAERKTDEVKYKITYLRGDLVVDRKAKTYSLLVTGGPGGLGNVLLVTGDLDKAYFWLHQSSKGYYVDRAENSDPGNPLLMFMNAMDKILNDTPLYHAFVEEKSGENGERLMRFGTYDGERRLLDMQTVDADKATLLESRVPYFCEAGLHTVDAVVVQFSDYCLLDPNGEGTLAVSADGKAPIGIVGIPWPLSVRAVVPHTDTLIQMTFYAPDLVANNVDNVPSGRLLNETYAVFDNVPVGQLMAEMEGLPYDAAQEAEDAKLEPARPICPRHPGE
jgi:hypothetical protein